MLRSLRGLAPVLIIGFASFGCAPDGGTVSGTATLDGKPLSAGTVTLHPATGGPVAIGNIDSSGHYKAVVGSGDPLPPGDYVATVISNEPPVPSANPKMAPMPGKRITPEKYGDVAKSDLKVTVKAGSNTIDLKLSSK